MIRTRTIHIPVRDYLPLQQGLRRVYRLSYENDRLVRDYLPLQQGLRLSWPSILLFLFCVRDYLPLQQGLRRKHNRLTRVSVLGQRLSSTTTRIKTRGARLWEAAPAGSETIFHYNKD